MGYASTFLSGIMHIQLKNKCSRPIHAITFNNDNVSLKLS